MLSPAFGVDYKMKNKLKHFRVYLFEEKTYTFDHLQRCLDTAEWRIIGLRQHTSTISATILYLYG